MAQRHGITECTTMLVNSLLLLLLMLLPALAMQPWRAVGHAGPPWPWLAWWAVLPLF